MPSIVDICIQTPMISLEEMHPLAEALDKRMPPPPPPPLKAKPNVADVAC